MKMADIKQLFAPWQRADATGRRSRPLASRVSLLLLGFVVLLLGGYAYLSGAAPVLTLGLVLVGLAAVIAALALSRELPSPVPTTAAPETQELEALADRMWEMQESEQRFYGLLEALGDLVVHRDRDGRILYANRVLAELMECEVQELIGKTLPELGIDVPLVPDAAFSDGESLSSIDVPIHGRGGLRWFSWTELSLRDNDDSVSHWAIARDVTARKRAETALVNARERAEQANVAKSRFLATVSHEIRDRKSVV